MKVRISNNEPQGIYTNDFLSQNEDKVINGQLVSEWTLTELFPTENLKKPIWNGSEWVEGATPQEIAEKQSEELQQKETELYEKRIADGIRKYAEISARFRLAKQNGQLDPELHIYLENTLRPVRNEVLAGQWITAKELMDEIMEEHVSIPAFDEIYQMIINYINTEGQYYAP